MHWLEAMSVLSQFLTPSTARNVTKIVLRDMIHIEWFVQSPAILSRCDMCIIAAAAFYRLWSTRPRVSLWAASFASRAFLWDMADPPETPWIPRSRVRWTVQSSSWISSGRKTPRTMNHLQIVEVVSESFVMLICQVSKQTVNGFLARSQGRRPSAIKSSQNQQSWIKCSPFRRR